MKNLLPLIFAALLTGCTFAGRTSIAHFDNTQHPPTTNVEIYQRGIKPDRPYKEIALLTVDGEAREEADALTGFLQIARTNGANAILIDPPAGQATFNSVGVGTTNTGIGSTSQSGYTVVPNSRCVFRATLVVWAPKP